MDKTRTLPPLVRGRVTGVLDFYVDEIRLFKHIQLVTNSFDLVLQVQWWGESSPALIRPKELQIQSRIYRNPSRLKSYQTSAKYEIKTNLNLFKSYLNACEVVELSVLQAIENYVIGSAFLRDLFQILNNNNEFITMPVFDYLGEEIGEVVIHTNFSEQSTKMYEISNICKNYNKSEKPNSPISNRLGSSYLSLAEKTLFYKTHSVEENQKKYSPPVCGCGSKKNTKKQNSNSSDSDTLSKENEIYVSNNPNDSHFPEINTLDDSSKVLCFSSNSQNYKLKTDCKNPKPKVTNKFNSNSIKCKSKTKTSDKSTSFNNIVSNKKCIINKQKPAIQSTDDQFLEFEAKDLEKIPSKESSKVLDYLLGSDMSKDDEETALSDFKNMSPSHNLVDSISELYLKPVKNSLENQSRKLKSTKPAYLNFDFNNPIERNYYERFFLPSNSNKDFEIAEFLNKPEKKSRSPTKITEQSEFLKNDSESSLTKPQKEKIIVNSKRNCARCKYYKKLDELDTIIESLKHFEEKILSHEKNIQSDLNENSFFVNRRKLKDS